MHRQTLLAWAMIGTITSGCAGNYGSLPPVSSSSSGPYRLGAGDEIRVAVFGLDALTNTYVVSDTGAISVPLLQAIAVEGHTTSEVEALLTAQLHARDIAPRANVSVQIQKYRPFYILGEVQKPGEIPFAPGMTVLKAVSIAGGYTFRANTRHVIVTRAGPHPERARASVTDAVRPGDTILVPEAWF